MRVRSFLGCVTLAAALAAAAACKMRSESASSVKGDDSSQPHTEATHGMFVFGGTTVYMYHLPMWSWPHNYEVIVETELPAAVKAQYDTERGTGRKMFTYVPDRFYLPDLMSGQKTSMHGSLVFGHFEQDQDPKKIDDVTVTVTRVVFQKRLDPQEAAPASATYEVFGKGSEWYAAHKATHQPDYDQILALTGADSALSAEQQAAATEVAISGQSNATGDRLQAGADTTSQTADGTSVPFKVSAETYFNTGDLQ